MKGDKLYFLRRIGNVTENVIKTIKNAKNVVVFDASLQKDKRGKQKVIFPFLKNIRNNIKCVHIQCILYYFSVAALFVNFKQTM